MKCFLQHSELYSGSVRAEQWRRIQTLLAPAPYAENANCRYTLSAEATLQLELHFYEDFNVEQSPDGQCIDALRVGVEFKYLNTRLFYTGQSRKQSGSSDK